MKIIRTIGNKCDNKKYSYFELNVDKNMKVKEM